MVLCKKKGGDARGWRRRNAFDERYAESSTYDICRFIDKSKLSIRYPTPTYTPLMAKNSIGYANS